MCRTRRIKCDETKPTCNQCAKSRRQCPGYKDEFDLVFRNETQATERRAKKANKKAMSQKHKQEEKDGFRSPSEIGALRSPDGSLKSPTDAFLANLKIPLEQQATCHFMSNFVLVPRQGSTRGFLDFLIPLMKAETTDTHLKHAFNACALAHLDNRVHSGDDQVKDKALAEYTKALHSTNQALRDPEGQKQDGTLAAVLLLGLFEVCRQDALGTELISILRVEANITAKQMGMLAWGSHTEGAIQIVKQRGRKQLRTKTGLLLFIAVRTQMIIHTLSTGKAPIMGVEWWLADAVKDEEAARCQRLNIKTSELRAEVTRLMTSVARTPENIELMLDLIRRAQVVDQECVNWSKNLPEHWQYKTVAWEDNVPNGDYSKAEVFPGRVDVYTDFWIASVWNLVRVNRICLASVIVRCAAWACSPVDYRTTPEYATAARTVVDNTIDIIASVPYHLGWHLKRKDQLVAKNPSLSGFACGDDEDLSMKGLAGYFLTWPLACLVGQDYTTDSQRAWMIGRLEFIGDHGGVKYAHILAQLQVRIPSMLIRRDGLLASPYPMAHNFEKLLSARYGPPTAGYSMNPFQQREAMQKEYIEQKKQELMNKALAGGNQQTNWVASKWLSMSI
ncbi:negative acting factor [Zalerion maritima]|uniref:Negative acting factor n=1 Tax=Zalerion maritima TaxID=339359 RepID=A0AAD5RUX1_9PEZI|nr:negative acting factor [Zalerion maritima]